MNFIENLPFWRPLGNESATDGWCSYLRANAIIDYTTDKIGGYIKEATNQLVSATQQLGYSLDRIARQQEIISYKMNILIEQQMVTNMLLEDIVELLKIPDVEKERQHYITLGLKFFSNAAVDPDLYSDSLENLLLAEKMQPQDYFVLNKIGCIYLFSEKLLDLDKSIDYFIKAGKYASIESDPKAVTLANYLTNNVNSAYVNTMNDKNSIRALAAASYQLAAQAYYIEGKDPEAISFQQKADKLYPTSASKFYLAKYFSRTQACNDACRFLDYSITLSPQAYTSFFLDADLLSNAEAITLVKNKEEDADNLREMLISEFSELIDKGIVVKPKTLDDLYSASDYIELRKQINSATSTLKSLKHVL